VRKHRYPNPGLVKLHRPYTVAEVARLLDKHPRTILEWIKASLPIVDRHRPFLIRGRDLRAFLEARRASRRRPCPPGTLYCFGCREARRPALGLADFEPHEHGAGNLVALCETCGRIMRRRVNAARLHDVLPEIDVRVVAGGASHSGV
jgi:hypothetical protein